MSKELTIVEVLAKHVKMEPKTLWGERTIWSKDAVKAMQEYSDQNTKPLIDEIAELRKEVEYQKSGYVTLKEYLKTDDILGAITKLKSELKASKSEANEALQKSHDELLKIAKHYIKNHDYWVIANADKLTRNNK